MSQVFQAQMGPPHSRPMARALRLEISGADYHGTIRGNARQNIVRDNQDHTHFLACSAQTPIADIRDLYFKRLIDEGHGKFEEETKDV